ncbi:NINE Protein [Sodalis glossinidius str. 'morsitans']|uniref:NINE Protein n=2 Tax=Sodalis glossinidius TaxID=63612 RepID=A0A193QMA1_SODGM|nr:NINE Protein [Sodalis glossinidius str. 'morsitans']CRL46233.1 NINE Protein [Sodalis glossinidius str. 'morsitans']
MRKPGMMQHCLFRPTERSRNKAREIPAEAAVTTYDYSAHIRDVQMMRARTRRGIGVVKMN